MQQLVLPEGCVETETLTEERQSSSDRSRSLTDMATSQRAARISGRHRTSERGEASSPESSEGPGPADTLMSKFWPPAW